MGQLTLHIVTPKGSMEPIACDSIHLTICDDVNGRGGGSYGIRSGHAKALLSLEKGETKAFLAGKKVFLAECGGGFATVDRDEVTVVVEECISK